MARRTDCSTGIFTSFPRALTIEDSSAEVAYFNQAHRWNWGVIGGQILYLSGGFQSAIGHAAGAAGRS